MSNPAHDKKGAYTTAPENALRKKIGAHVALSTIFTPEKLKHCQEMLDEALDSFVQEMESQLSIIGDEYTKAVDDPAQAEAAVEKAAELAFLLKKRMESLNYVFGYNVAESLCDYIQHTAKSNSEALLVICKHLAVLNIIIKDGIKGDGGPVGKEMLANLKTLIVKTQK